MQYRSRCSATHSSFQMHNNPLAAHFPMAGFFAIFSETTISLKYFDRKLRRKRQQCDAQKA
jgi:hypothetical protein